MAHVIPAKAIDKSDSKPPFEENRRYLGVVKFFKESGYGFLKVSNYPDVFFHVTDLHPLGLKSTNCGDKFTFKVQKNPKDGKVGHKAFSMERCLRGNDVVQKKSNAPMHPERRGGWDSERPEGLRSKKDGHSGSLVAIPHPKDIRQNQKKSAFEVARQNGEIAVKNFNGEKPKTNSDQLKPIKMKPGIIKVGPPCSLPKAQHGPDIVSATGPNSAEMAPYMNPEIANLKEAIVKKKTIFRSLKVETLPDGGRRLRDDISALEKQLRDLIIKENSSGKTNLNHQNGKEGKENTYPVPTKTEKKKSILKSAFDGCSLPRQQPSVGVDKGAICPINVTGDQKLVQSKLEFVRSGNLGTKIGQSEFTMYEPILFPDGPLYGGRMTTTRLTEVRKVTKAAIEDLHKSLSTRPEPEGELQDPSGLKVSLMVHQKQALAWLVWREAQTLSGGILADDMGLGKTLTMISLILAQRENEEGKPKTIREEEEYDIQDFDCSVDSDVILIEDAKKDTNPEVAKNKCGSSPNSMKNEKKSHLVASESTLIVAPASLLFHWENEIRNRCDKGLLSIHLFHGASREKEPTRLAEFDVVITTYDIVRRCGSAKETGSKDGEATLMDITWRRIILDESHHVKNFKSQSSEAVCKLEARTRWAMSGTPVQNNLTDMYAMLKFLHCRPFDEYKVWKNQVDNKTQNGKERLKTLISCIVLRREKSNSTPSGAPLVDLPKRTFVTHRLKLSDIEREVYDKLQSDSKAAFRKFQENKKGNTSAKNSPKLGLQGPANSINSKENSVTATTLLVMLLRLRQCCGHLSLLKESFDPELLSNEKKELALEDLFHSMDINKTPVKMADIDAESFVAKDKRQHFEKSSLSGKLEFVLDELNKLRFERPGDKCVIISQWTSMLEVIAHHLDKSQISYSIIKGSVSAKKRMDVVDEFNRNPARPMVVLLSLQAGGVGLNLIGGNHLFLLDMHWNPALECQAFDRIYRVGQKKPVFIHKFVVEETVEERILKLQEHKLSLAKAVMQGMGSDQCKKLTLQDMKLLFGI